MGFNKINTNKMMFNSKSNFQVKQSSKDDIVLIGTDHGYLVEFSLSKKRFVHNFGQQIFSKKIENEHEEVLDRWGDRKTPINLLEKTSDKKNFYICGEHGYFKEFKTRNRK